MTTPYSCAGTRFPRLRRGKFRYRNWLEAVQAAIRTERNPIEGREGQQLTVYGCTHCGFIHIGHVPANTRLYFEGDELPPFTKSTPPTALPKPEKKRLKMQWGLRTGIGKPKYQRPVFAYGRGYQPFEGLSELLHAD